MMLNMLETAPLYAPALIGLAFVNLDEIPQDSEQRGQRRKKPGQRAYDRGKRYGVSGMQHGLLIIAHGTLPIPL